MKLARLIASFLGTGFAPRAPGTAGSLAALLVGALLLLLPSWVLPVGILAVIPAGIWATARAGGVDDPGWVVIDEVAGQWLALLPLARPTPLGLLAAFALFRLLDITKPGPIGWADRQHGAIGVMADDVIAGGIAALTLWAASWLWPGLWA